MGNGKKLLLISIDAMVWEDRDTLMKYPTFRRLLDRSARIETLRTVYPSLTYPAHASILTGTYPDRHGVIANNMFAPPHLSDRYEHYKNMKTADFVSVAQKSGLSAAIISWPVTSGYPCKWLIDRPSPELRIPVNAYWEKICEGSTPELMERIKPLCSGCFSYPEWYYTHDRICTIAICDLIRDDQPDIILSHWSLIDHMRHKYGVFNDALDAAYAFYDENISMILGALDEQKLFENTTIMLTSDHGQMDVNRVIFVNAFLAQNGFIDIDRNGQITDWTVCCFSCGLSAHVYFKERDDDFIAKVTNLLKQNSDLLCIESIYTKSEAEDKFRLSGDFSLVIEAKPGASFAYRNTGEIVQQVTPGTYNDSIGSHGHEPGKGSQSCAYICGPDIKPGARLAVASLVDEAPTFAHILGFDMPDTDGRVLTEIFL